MRYFFKLIVAGIIAFIFLNILCIFYYINPDSLPTKNGVTDFFWEPSSYYSKMTEGFGYGKMNNEGFNNIQDYEHNQPIDILLMGSSHMEGLNVPQKRTVAAVLNTLFNKSKYVYNIGLSGHEFPYIVNNIETAVRFYAPKEYVIIEIAEFEFDVISLEQGINSNLKRLAAADGKFIMLLKKIPYLHKIPYLRLLKLQYQNYRSSQRHNNYQGNNDAKINDEMYSQVLEAAFQKLSQIANNQKIRIILVYHPELRLNFDGSLHDSTDVNRLTLFEKYSAENDIVFINMIDRFRTEYKSFHIAPYGYSNTEINVGHLNRYGHQMIADELYM